jgi:drug/metabolite transporter (DMT)-like permease
VADFFGGLQSRRLPSLAVAVWSQAAGGLTLALVLALTGQVGGTNGLAWGAAAGVFGGLGLAFFYRGLSVGLMSIVAPIAACGAAVPVVLALALGQAPAALALLGMAAAMAGVVLASLPGEQSQTHPAGDARLALLMALGAAITFGLFFVFLDLAAATGDPPLWVVGGARVGSLVTLGLVALAGRQALPYPGRRMPAVALIGIADTTANALFAYATVEGNLGAVSVLGSLYPLATIALARVILAERLARSQAAGVSLALLGVVLIAAG